MKIKTIILRTKLLSLALLTLPLLAFGSQARPESWAKPVVSSHLKNFYQLDDKVYRSAQPNQIGFQELKRLGIRNILNLRDYHSDKDAQGVDLKLFRVKMEAGEITDDKVIEALKIIKQSDGPILIHCWHGSDRTGLLCAMYRIVFQGWTKEDAIDEFLLGGYGYHAMYKNIPAYIKHVNIDKIKQALSAY